MADESKVEFPSEVFDEGACACFVKEGGKVAVDVRASFSIDPAHVKRRFATHSFVEFSEVSTGACLVQTGNASAHPCVFILTDAALSNAVLREIGRRASQEFALPVFLFANAKAQMVRLETEADPRLDAFAETLLAAARHVLKEP